MTVSSGPLTKGVCSNSALLEHSLAASRQGRDNLRRFISSSPDEAAAIPPEETWNLVYLPFIRDWSASLSNGYLDATVGSGKLALIGSPELRAALSRFRGKQEDVNDVLAHLDALNRREAIVLGEFPDVLQALGNVRPPNEIGDSAAEPLVISAPTLARMRRHPDVGGTAAAKLIFWNGYLHELEEQQAVLEETLALIRTVRP